jgi:hypothetical protein
VAQIVEGESWRHHRGITTTRVGVPTAQSLRSTEPKWLYLVTLPIPPWNTFTAAILSTLFDTWLPFSRRGPVAQLVRAADS